MRLIRGPMALSAPSFIFEDAIPFPRRGREDRKVWRASPVRYFVSLACSRHLGPSPVGLLISENATARSLPLSQLPLIGCLGCEATQSVGGRTNKQPAGPGTRYFLGLNASALLRIIPTRQSCPNEPSQPTETSYKTPTGECSSEEKPESRTISHVFP